MTIISTCAVLSELDLKISNFPFPGVDLVATVFPHCCTISVNSLRPEEKYLEVVSFNVYC